MTPAEACTRLDHALARDTAGRYSFMCKKAFVMVKLFGKPDRLRFAAREHLAFRAEDGWLVIERCDTGALHRRFTWDEIECLAAGEAETDSGSLFQG